ncbi:hypothetical protein BDZ91DRAFT_718414 [Kalaharituber pfeilii]|nr:hypothetical protein BDZ91DRAFT_718414 [Kalaharituber pfeilii]
MGILFPFYFFYVWDFKVKSIALPGSNEIKKNLFFSENFFFSFFHFPFALHALTYIYRQMRIQSIPNQIN